MMHGMDPKGFYDTRMLQKLGADYEHARWHSSPTQEAQYGMMRTLLDTRVAQYLKGAERILEIGPGPGTWTKRLMHALPRGSFTLLDISSEMLSRARATLGDSAEFIEKDFSEYSAERAFDAFFSSRAIEYMPDKVRVVESIARLLAPKGRGVVITKMPKPLFDRVARRKLSNLHRGQIAPRELLAHLHKAGLRVDSVRIATATIPLLRSAFVNRVAFTLLSRLPFIVPFSFFAESYAVFFRKPL